MTMAKAPDTNDFWTRFEKLRSRNGYSQTDIARELRIAHSTIQRWKQKPPGRENLLALARLFNVPVEALHEEPELPSRKLVDAAQQAGLPTESAVSHALATLEAFLRVRGHAQETKSPADVYSTTTGVIVNANAESLLESRVWKSLSREQQMGLALLVNGYNVPDWRIRAALELLALDTRTPLQVVRDE